MDIVILHLCLFVLDNTEYGYSLCVELSGISILASGLQSHVVFPENVTSTTSDRNSIVFYK